MKQDASHMKKNIVQEKQTIVSYFLFGKVNVNDRQQEADTKGSNAGEETGPIMMAN